MKYIERYIKGRTKVILAGKTHFQLSVHILSLVFLNSLFSEKGERSDDDDDELKENQRIHSS